MAKFYDASMKNTEARCLGAWRRELMASLEGDIIEVGAGTGVNLDFYDSAKTHLTLTEPEDHMRRILEQRARERQRHRIDVRDAGSEDLPFEDGRFDAVVSTLVLCSVKEVKLSLAEVRRVLRPGGRFVFLEHVAAEDNPGRLKWQQRLEPLWIHLGGNCHLTRRTLSSITDAGFEIERLSQGEMLPAPAVVRPTIRGVALK
jgi:ubiquinone/menaquinone biosynthesis C-methylase UbiE